MSSSRRSIMSKSTLDTDPARGQDPTTGRDEFSLPLPPLIVLTPAQTKEVAGGCSKCGRSAVLASDLIA
jgi:hypothetical protein